MALGAEGPQVVKGQVTAPKVLQAPVVIDRQNFDGVVIEVPQVPGLLMVWFLKFLRFLMKVFGSQKSVVAPGVLLDPKVLEVKIPEDQQ